MTYVTTPKHSQSTRACSRLFPRRCRSRNAKNTNKFHRVFGFGVGWFFLAAGSLLVVVVTGREDAEQQGTTEQQGRAHAHTDFFPANEEYDSLILDPLTVYGSPLGGFSRATRGRLAAMPLPLLDIQLDNGEDEDVIDEIDLETEPSEIPTPTDEMTKKKKQKKDPQYMQVRDSDGRLFACRVYHEDELEPSSLTDSMFDTPRFRREAPAPSPATGEDSSDDSFERPKTAEEIEMWETKVKDATEYLVALKVADISIREIEEAEEYLDNLNKQKDIPPEVEKSFQKRIQDMKDQKDAAASTMGDHPNSKKQVPSKDLTETEIFDRLSPLVGICGQIHKGWWSYEWCFEQHVSQFHVEIDGKNSEIRIEDPTNLGVYEKREVITGSDLLSSNGNKLAESNVELARIMDVHTGGDLCDETGQPRKSFVHLKCCSNKVMGRRKGMIHKNGHPLEDQTAALLELSEDKDEICVYHLTVCTPLLCDNGDDSEELSSSAAGSPNDMMSGIDSFKSREQAENIAKIERARMLKKENESVLEILSRTLGDVCIQTLPSGWWTYELCHGREVKQFHEDIVQRNDANGIIQIRTIDGEHSLGHYQTDTVDEIRAQDEWKYVVNETSNDGGSGGSTASGSNRQNQKHGTKGGGNGAYFELEYTLGTVCDDETVTDSAVVAGSSSSTGGKSGNCEQLYRSSSVRYYCGDSFEVAVNEDHTCHYVVTVKVPDLCEHPFFKAPVYKQQVIKCLPVDER